MMETVRAFEMSFYFNDIPDGSDLYSEEPTLVDFQDLSVNSWYN
jgi:hypothetical protein